MSQLMAMGHDTLLSNEGANILFPKRTGECAADEPLAVFRLSGMNNSRQQHIHGPAFVARQLDSQQQAPVQRAVDSQPQAACR